MQVSGRWSYCSGITYADWLFAGCVLADGRQPDDGSPVLRAVTLPKAELEILDTWHTSGLRGTGSHDAVANGVFVPERRVLSIVDGPPPHSTPLYRVPLLGLFATLLAAVALGNARGAIDELVNLAASKKTLGSSRSLAEQPATQSALAQSEASLRATRLLVFQAVEDASQAAQTSEPTPMPLRVGLRLAATHAVRTSAEVTWTMYDLGGGTAIREDSPLQRRFRDAHTMTAHIQVTPATFEVTGRLLLDLPTQTEYF